MDSNAFASGHAGRSALSFLDHFLVDVGVLVMNDTLNGFFREGEDDGLLTGNHSIIPSITEQDRDLSKVRACVEFLIDPF